MDYLDYRRSRFNSISQIQCNIYTFKTTQSKKFCNWLTERCKELRVDINELWPEIKSRKYSLCGVQIIVDIKYININMIKVISNIITSHHDYKIEIKIFSNSFGVRIIPCDKNDKYEILINDISDISIHDKNNNIIPIFYVVE